MSEIFFKDLLRLIVYFFTLAIMAIGIVQFNLLYIMSRELVFYYAYVGSIGLFVALLSKCLNEYKRFTERSFLFFPKCEEPEPKFESADLEKLWLWSKGATWKEASYNSPYECNQAVRAYMKKSLETSSHDKT